MSEPTPDHVIHLTDDELRFILDTLRVAACSNEAHAHRMTRIKMAPLADAHNFAAGSARELVKALEGYLDESDESDE